MRAFGKKKETVVAPSQDISPVDVDVEAPAHKGRKSLNRLSRKKLVIIFVAIMVITGGLLYFKLKPTNSPSTINSCTEDNALIQEYNTIANDQGVTKLSQLTEKIKQKPEFETDPTCQYMLMVAGYGAGDNAKRLETYQNLKKLEAGGDQVSDKINDGIDRNAVDKIIQQQIEEKGEKRVPGQG